MPTFRADCSSCCGLCCVVPGHLALQGFGFDKPAEAPCQYLNSNHLCSIHATRRLHGYAACAGFDCFGAGQWITQKLFGGARWTDSPDLALQMFAAYRYWAPRFQAAALIEAALPHVRDGEKQSLASLITTLVTDETTGNCSPIDAGRLRRETLAIIRSALREDKDNMS